MVAGHVRPLVGVRAAVSRRVQAMGNTGRGLTRRRFVQAGLTAAAGLAAARCRSAGIGSGQGRAPNVVFVFPDQFRAMALGFLGEDPVLTPHLDRFAAESVFFPNAVSNFPVCSPYRGMLLTGRWPYSTGLTGNCNSDAPAVFLRPEERCLTDVLAGAGYVCGYIGKWHLDTPGEEDARYGEGRRGDGRVWDAFTPPGPRRHGMSFWHAYGCCDRHLRPHYWVGDAPVSQPLQVEDWSVRHETDVAVEFLRNPGGRVRDPAKPFALFVAFNPPHPPFAQVPDEYRRRWAGRGPEELLKRPNVPTDGRADAARSSVADYMAAIAGVDDQFGQILEALDESGLREDTLVVFTSDHGEMMGSHGRMGKGVPYEEAFRIPLLMRFPGRLRPGREGLHLNVPDMMPTLLGLLGLRERIPPQVEGRDWSGLLAGAETPRPASSFFIVCGQRPEWGQRGVRTDRYTFVVTRGGGAGARAMLFDRETDPWQMQDRAGPEPETCRRLLAELNRWLEATRDPWGRLEWPLAGAGGSFPVQVAAGGFRIDFEPGGGPVQASPASPVAVLTTDPAEVLSGNRSLRCDSRGSTARFHECLRLEGLLARGCEYQVTYRYRVVASGDRTQFYTVVRSSADIARRAVRLYWSEPPGEAKTRTFRFRTEDISDHHLLFGVEYEGAILLDDIVVTPVE